MKQNRFEVSADMFEEEFLAGSDNVDMAHRELEFYDLLRALPKESRVIFQLYFGEQFTTAEIADMLHMKENTVKSRIRRGKVQLRKKMEKE